jgi:hypothetical protein
MPATSGQSHETTHRDQSVDFPNLTHMRFAGLDCAAPCNPARILLGHAV